MATAGQMTASAFRIGQAAGAIPMKKGRVVRALESWRRRFERSSKKTMGMVFVSAVFDIPRDN
jgi:hypothetical protein